MDSLAGVALSRNLERLGGHIHADRGSCFQFMEKQRGRRTVPAAEVQDRAGLLLAFFQAALEPNHPALGKIFAAFPGWRDSTGQRLFVRGGVLIEKILRIIHRRDIPRTLRKKLERTTWNPSVKHTTPGITMRSVFSGSSGPNWRMRQYSRPSTHAPAPARISKVPATRPTSRVMYLNIRVRRASSGSRPSEIAKILVNVANTTD